MTPGEIKARRLAYPLTTDDLAKRIGVSTQAVRSWERGDRTPVGPSRAALERLFAKRAGCSCTCHGGNPNSRRGVPSWGEGEQADLKRLIEKRASPDHVVAFLETRYGYRRTRSAIVDRASRLGLTFYVSQYSATAAAQRLGVSRRRIDHWITTGQLRATRHVGIARGRLSHWWRIEADDLEAFARARGRTA